MKANPLQTENSDVRLIDPDIERDAQISVRWLEGDIGRNTLKLMGVADKDNQPTTLEKEKKRIAGFIENPEQLNWMIEYGDQVVGSIWVDLQPKGSVPSPAIHMMIGDPTLRGQGIGYSASSEVINYLRDKGNKTIYSRYLSQNASAKELLARLGFIEMGEPYTDESGLVWQNAETPTQSPASA